MNRSHQKPKLRGYRTFVEALTLGAVLPIVGCQSVEDEAVDPEIAPALAALLEDGPLPATMAGATAREVPPRFCDNGGFPFPGDGGMPDFGGGSGGFGSGGPGFGSNASGGFGSTTGGFGSGGGTGFDGTSTGGFGSGGSTGFDGSGGTGFDSNSTGGFGSGGSNGFDGTGGTGFDSNSTGGFGSGGSNGFDGTGGTGFDSNSTGGFGSGGSNGFNSSGGTGFDGNSTGGFGSGGSTGFNGGTTGGGFESGTCEDDPIGFWRFDDCNGFRSNLQDSSNEFHLAFRAVDVECVPGKEGLAVSISKPEDLVYAPDQPGFVLDQGVTVAAWVKPTKLEGVSTIFRKRDDTNSAFALLLNGKKFQFVVKLESGKLATVSAPAKAGVFTHVAASYDGTYLRLYKDGNEVGKTKAVGKLARGAGPLLMGNDISKRRLHGLLDNAWFNTLPAPAETIMELTCVHETPSFTITPEVAAPVAPGTPVQYALSVTNRDAPHCAPQSFAAFLNVTDGLSAGQGFIQTSLLAGGATETVPFEVSSSDDIEPGSYPFTVSQIPFGPVSQTQASARATYVVEEPSGCHVKSGRELLIRDVSVVDDPVRTTMSGASGDPRTGAWTFARLMERLSPSAAAAPDLAEAMFQSFLSPQVVNGFTISTRPPMSNVLQAWPRTADGKLDLSRAPMRLLAIVHRLDLEDLSKGKAGEGRLVYGVLDSLGNPMEFTVIFEYSLLASSAAEARAWADDVHALGSLPFPSEAYNVALQALTDRFSGRFALPGAPNGSALIDIRTNEIALGGQWQLREFRLSPQTGLLEPAVVAQTPDFSFHRSPMLGRYINENESIILTERHDVPLTFEGSPFAAASVFNNIDTWDAPGITNPEARFRFSLNTCNGCHGGETQTGFLHITPRQPGQTSRLSGFLTGITVFDPVARFPRRLAELSRRRALLESVVCEAAAP